MKTRWVLLVLLATTQTALFGQMSDNTSLLQFDTYKVDNAFLNSQDPFHNSGSPLVKYLGDVINVDIAYRKANPSDYWGALSDKYENFIYYYDSDLRQRRFGYDHSTGKRFLGRVGPVLTTCEGSIYAVDQNSGTLYSWDRTKESFAPAGTVNRHFDSVAALAKSPSGNVYILEGNSTMSLSCYNPASQSFVKFGSGADRLDLKAYYSPDWGDVSGLAVSPNGIYVSFVPSDLGEEKQLVHGSGYAAVVGLE